MCTNYSLHQEFSWRNLIFLRYLLISIICCIFLFHSQLPSDKNVSKTHACFVKTTQVTTSERVMRSIVVVCTQWARAEGLHVDLNAYLSIPEERLWTWTPPSKCLSQAHSVAARCKHVFYQTSRCKYSLVALASSLFPLVSQSWITLCQCQKCRDLLW